MTRQPVRRTAGERGNARHVSDREAGTRGLAQGFTVVELALVLVIAALIAVSGLRWLHLMNTSGQSVAAQSQASAAREAVIAFARANRRLPCPDLIGNGLEGTCASGTRQGWLPIVALEMADRSDPAMLETRPRYAVFRSSAVDLVRPDQTGTAGPDQAFVRALKIAAAQPFGGEQPHIAPTPAGCGAAQANAAFALRVPVQPEGRDLPTERPCFPLSAPMSSETAAGLLAVFSDRT